MNNSEEFRRECEARRVLKMGDEQRKSYYEGVLKHRGRERTNQLICDVNRMRREMREGE